MSKQISSILVYGYGNPGRQDDGLGIKLAEKVENWAQEKNYTQVSVDSNYQLNLEDAAILAEHDLVIFADASEEKLEDYRMDSLLPDNRVEFSMHAVSPAFLLHLCKEVFHREPEAYLLHIRGYAWEFMEEMTPEASRNLNLALEYVTSFVANRLMDQPE